MTNYEKIYENTYNPENDKRFLISKELINEVKAKLDSLNYYLCFITPYSTHPDDYYLFDVVARYKEEKHPVYGKNNYTKWSLNNSGDTISLFYGHYGLSKEEANELVCKDLKIF